MKILVRTLIAFAALTLPPLVWTVATLRAQSNQVRVAGGSSAVIVCDGARLTTTRQGDTQITVKCQPNPTPTPTPTPAPTPTPGAVGVCGESTHLWHPPVINGCASEHEHGDAPPSWIKAAGFDPMFCGDFNTSLEGRHAPLGSRLVHLPATSYGEVLRYAVRRTGLRPHRRAMFWDDNQVRRDLRE